jgi:hypothetical protein
MKKILRNLGNALKRKLLKSWNFIKKWALKYLSSFFVLAFIMLISYLLIKVGTKIDNNTANILLAVGGVASTFFLYLTFRENRKSNELKIIEDVYKDLKHEVIDKELKSQKQVFSELNINELNRILNYPKLYFHNIVFSDFVYNFHPLFLHIKDNTSYNEYMTMLVDNNKPVLLKDKLYIDEASKMSNAFNIIRYGIKDILHNYVELLMVYESINESSLEEKQKIYLIKKLNEITSVYYYFFKTPKDEFFNAYPNAQYLFDCCTLLKEFKLFTFNENNSISKCTTPFESISYIKDYTKIKEKYN